MNEKDERQKAEQEYQSGHTHAHPHAHTHVDADGHIYMHEHEYDGEQGACGYEHEHSEIQRARGHDYEFMKTRDAHVHDHEHPGEETIHRHVHTQAEKKAVLNRLSKAIGHMEAVRRMVERDEDCSAVLIQLAAVRSAINNTGKLVLKNHINHCIMEAVEENDRQAIEMLDQAIDKFM